MADGKLLLPAAFAPLDWAGRTGVFAAVSAWHGLTVRRAVRAFRAGWPAQTTPAGSMWPQSARYSHRHSLERVFPKLGETATSAEVIDFLNHRPGSADYAARRP